MSVKPGNALISFIGAFVSSPARRIADTPAACLKRALPQAKRQRSPYLNEFQKTKLTKFCFLLLSKRVHPADLGPEWKNKTAITEIGTAPVFRLSRKEMEATANLHSSPPEWK
jgi:hypothetical protein